MVKVEGKKNTLAAFFAIVWVPSILLILLEGTGSLSAYINASFYVAATISCIGVLGTIIKSDDKFYANLTRKNLLFAVIVALFMTLLSWGLSMQLNNQAFISLSTIGPLSIMASNSSVFTDFLSLALFGLVMVATAEELFKLTMFAELKERYGGRWYGVLIYVGFPVGFWSLLHGVEAQSNMLLIVPIFINGILLIIYLWRTKCILGCIFAHWIFNSLILVISFFNGTAGVPAGMPFLPSLSSLTVTDVAVVSCVSVAVLFFLIPILTQKHERY